MLARRNLKSARRGDVKNECVNGKKNLTCVDSPQFFDWAHLMNSVFVMFLIFRPSPM